MYIKHRVIIIVIKIVKKIYIFFLNYKNKPDPNVGMFIALKANNPEYKKIKDVNLI